MNQDQRQSPNQPNPETPSASLYPEPPLSRTQIWSGSLGIGLVLAVVILRKSGSDSVVMWWFTSVALALALIVLLPVILREGRLIVREEKREEDSWILNLIVFAGSTALLAQIADRRSIDFFPLIAILTISTVYSLRILDHLLKRPRLSISPNGLLIGTRPKKLIRLRSLSAWNWDRVSDDFRFELWSGKIKRVSVAQCDQESISDFADALRCYPLREGGLPDEPKPRLGVILTMLPPFLLAFLGLLFFFRETLSAVAEMFPIVW